MNPFSLILLFYLFSITLYSQQFLWAESYNITNCNEVAALAVDTSGYIFISGIHDAPSSVPYTGNCYLQKADPEGEVIWTKYFSGSLHFGDMAAINGSVVIIGQSSGPFIYQEEEYGTSAYFMFMFKVDADGNHEWHIIDETKHGRYSNIAVGKLGDFAVQVRGQGNLGDWVWTMNEAGDILNSRVISASESTIVDIAYYDDWVYLNGGFNGPGSLIIDTIVINTQPVENTTFTLALNQDLVAKWIATDTTINNFDGRVVASGSGVFVFETTLEPIFTSVNYLKKFGFDGQLIHEVVVPTYTTAVAMYPDMTISPNMIGLFTKNASNSNSHAVFLYSTNLDLISEKFIDGPSSHYSGQIANFEDDLFVGHVHSGNLIFSDGITLPYFATGNLPYIAKIGTPSITGLNDRIELADQFLVYPNPADDKISISIKNKEVSNGRLTISDMTGNIVMRQSISGNKLTIDIRHLQQGIYLVQLSIDNKISHIKKIIIQ